MQGQLTRSEPLENHDLLSPHQAQARFRAADLEAQSRLMKACAWALGITTTVGLLGALVNAWPLIGLGFLLGTAVLGQEWRRWNPPISPHQTTTGKALVRWLEAQPYSLEAALALIRESSHGLEVMEVARWWVKVHESH